jgi:hypothetical protein
MGGKNTGFRDNNQENDKIFKKIGKIAIFSGNKSTNSIAVSKGGEDL